jgi:hypothetical protein
MHRRLCPSSLGPQRASKVEIGSCIRVLLYRLLTPTLATAMRIDTLPDRPRPKMRSINLCLILKGLLVLSDARPDHKTTYTSTLTPLHFLGLDSQRVKVSYGRHIVQSRLADDGMTAFTMKVEAPCSDCMITTMQAHLEYPNGSVADADTDMWMHHVVLLNMRRNDSVCPDSMHAQRFFASGNGMRRHESCCLAESRLTFVLLRAYYGGPDEFRNSSYRLPICG